MTVMCLITTHTSQLYITSTLLSEFLRTNASPWCGKCMVATVVNLPGITYGVVIVSVLANWYVIYWLPMMSS